MDRQVMNSMTIDCKHANEQIAFIQSQAPSDEDSIKNSLMIRGWSGFISSMKDGTYNARRDWDDGARSNAVRIQVYNIQKTCAR
jgi:hypothetical protein